MLSVRFRLPARASLGAIFLSDGLKMLKNTFITVAIDGGAAVGKSSTAIGLSKRFGWLHVNTGLHYRLLTYCCLNAQFKPEENEALIDFLSHLNLGTKIVDDLSAVCLLGEEYVDEANLRTAAINQAVSLFAALPAIRKKLLTYQRSLVDFAQAQGFKGIVMEGRDIGSVVLPNATFIFFLKADLNIRAQRRQQQDDQVDDIAQRDFKDGSRKAAPLICPEKAYVMDTTCMTLEQVIEEIAVHITTSNSFA